MKKLLRLHGILSCCLVLSFSSAAQGPTISRYDLGPSLGLMNTAITDIVRDHQGFLWIGSEDGLARFDGRRFDQFKKIYPAGRRISGLHVERIVPRADGQLVLKYMHEDDRLEVFDPQTWQNLPLIDRYDGKIASIACEADAAQVIVLLNNDVQTGTYYLNERNELESRYSIRRAGCDAISIHPTLQSDWIVFENGQILEFDKQGKERRSLRAPALNQLNYKREKYVEFIHEISEGDCVFSFEAIPGLYLLRQGSDELYKIEGFVPSAQYTGVWKDNNGNRLLYAGSSFRQEQKLLFWHHEAQQFQDVSSWLNSRNEVTMIFGTDFYEGFAIGYTNGFDVMHLVPDQFRRYLMQEVRWDEWGTSTRGIWQDKYKNTYVAREINNWFRITESGRVDTLEIFTPENPFTYQFKCARNLLQVGSNLVGSAHFGDDSYGIFLYDPATNKTEIVPIPNHVQHMVRIGDTIWIACGDYGGKGDVYLLDPETWNLEPFRDPDGNNPFHAEILFTIEKISPNLLWIGGTDGIYQIHTVSREITHFNARSDPPFDFIDIEIMDLHKHSDGSIYIGYRSAGFEIVSPDRKTKTQYTVHEGLPNDKIASFVEDSTGVVWIGTFGGLAKFDPVAKQFTNFFRSDGLPHNEFNRYSFYHSGSEIWMGTVNGVMSFNPYALSKERDPPRILLSELKYYDADGNPVQYHGAFNHPVSISIPAANRSLVAGFHLDNFLASRQHKYQYLVGDRDESQWQALGSEDELVLNYLPVGRYPIFIRGMDKYGNISENEIHLDLDVHQYLYESAWFYGFIALALLGLALLFIRARFQQKFRLFSVRQDISRDLHDEVGSLLTGLAMKTDLLAMKVKPELKDDTKKLGTMGRDAVRLMRDIVWSIDASKQTMQDLMDRIREFASEVFPEQGIAFEIAMENCNPESKLRPEVRKNVYLIVREAINNILKHSNATYVMIKMKKENSMCRIRITDNGRVTGKQTNSSGLGLKNMHERAEQISGQLDIDKDDGYDITLSFRP